ncbi:hypothetical protein E2C01_010368 [Portunus trituberculatus]|uniref:Uncharacterized protein n=1 Tax=Portunus trituberculatus TaxID=210409 RepID=A0A5B7D869_PORTR|nr:hypothetical protein [Portunus trituberculatus]
MPCKLPILMPLPATNGVIAEAEHSPCGFLAWRYHLSIAHHSATGPRERDPDWRSPMCATLRCPAEATCRAPTSYRAQHSARWTCLPKLTPEHLP